MLSALGYVPLHNMRAQSTIKMHYWPPTTPSLPLWCISVPRRWAGSCFAALQCAPCRYWGSRVQTGILRQHSKCGGTVGSQLTLR